MTTEFDLTESQKLTLAVVPRIAASISVVCVLFMISTILRNPYYRRRIYHRLMLGSTVPILILNAAQLWGQAAAPSGTPQVIGARGTYATCSAQGFLYQFRAVVPFYYVILTLLARRLVARKRRSTQQFIQRLVKMEVGIHIAVYILPLSSGIYLLSVQGFNMVFQGCGIASVPLGCGDQSEDGTLECTRGPQNPGMLQWVLVALPAIILVGSATLIMLATYIEIRRSSNKQVARSVAKQAALYLLVFYWTYIFRFIDAAIILGSGNYVFSINLLAEVIDPLQGLWTLLVYWYFRSEKPKTLSHDVPKNNAVISNVDPINTAGDQGSGSGLPLPQNNSQSKSSLRPEFSIFDGSEVHRQASPWAAFLYDEGEDEEYEQNNGEYTDDDYRTETLQEVPEISTFEPNI